MPPPGPPGDYHGHRNHPLRAGPRASAWGQLHPLLVRRSAWADHPEGELPVNAGTVVHFQVDRLPWEQDPKPV
ncbi:hypothetical protein ACIOZL_27410 [Streptomyces sp. NPDC087769]|uniref:hypothetical protein n=1 Tax=Streptomyces sp. NPDC087769 TaxID=3365802 RepID=UPI00381A28EA